MNNCALGQDLVSSTHTELRNTTHFSGLFIDHLSHLYLHSTVCSLGRVSDRWGHGLPWPTLKLTMCLDLVSPCVSVSQYCAFAVPDHSLHSATTQSLSITHVWRSEGTTVARVPSMHALQPTLSPSCPRHRTSRRDGNGILRNLKVDLKQGSIKVCASKSVYHYKSS